MGIAVCAWAQGRQITAAEQPSLIDGTMSLSELHQEVTAIRQRERVFATL